MGVTPFRKRDRYLVFGAPQFREEEIEEVVDSIRKGWIGTGPKVSRFEERFLEYKGGEGYAVAVNSCTAALHLAMVTARLDPGAEVITTPMTFCATVNAILHAGLKPVLADIDPDTMTIDPAALEEAITPKTKAIVPVHFTGRPCSMDEILDLAERHNLIVIEDCAHAVETEYRGRKAGTFGEFSCFSFYVTKNVACGEGGMVLTKDEHHADCVKRLALHGMDKDAWKRFSDDGYKHYYVVECGYKYNMTDLQAAIGIHQLARVEDNWLRRKAVWQHYGEALAKLPLTLPADPAPDTRHAYHLYPVLIDEKVAGLSRDNFLKALHRLNIGTGVHYLCLAEQPYYQKNLGWRGVTVPVATRIGRQVASLPLSAALTDEDVEDVVSAVHEVLGNIEKYAS